MHYSSFMKIMPCCLRFFDQFINFILSHEIIECASIIFIILSLQSLNSYKNVKKSAKFGLYGIILSVISFLFQFYCNTPVNFYIFAQKILAIIIISLLGTIIGYKFASKVKMESLPELMAIFHSFIGLCALLVDIKFLNELKRAENLLIIEGVFGIVVGAVTFSGSIIAFTKLKNQNYITDLLKKIIQTKSKIVNLCLFVIITIITIKCCTKGVSYIDLISLTASSLLLGITTIAYVNSTDMAIAISILNSYSGWAIMLVGLLMSNHILIIIGIIIGISGAMLSHFMCKSMNKSLYQILFQQNITYNTNEISDQPIQMASPEDVAFSLTNSNIVIIIPGYGMSTSRSQHIVKSIASELISRDIEVYFGIHPVAGRMPGHMDVLLAEASVDYALIKDVDEVNFIINEATLLIVGANDIVNPLAKTDKHSPLYGMPVFDVEKAKEIFIIKRSTSSGYSGAYNPLLHSKNAKIVLGEAKIVSENIFAAITKG